MVIARSSVGQELTLVGRVRGWLTELYGRAPVVSERLRTSPPAAGAPRSAGRSRAGRRDLELLRDRLDTLKSLYPELASVSLSEDAQNALRAPAPRDTRS